MWRVVWEGDGVQEWVWWGVGGGGQVEGGRRGGERVEEQGVGTLVLLPMARVGRQVE